MSSDARLEKEAARRGHALLPGAPPETLARFEAVFDDADGFVLDRTSEGTYLIYEPTDDDEGDDDE